MLMNSLHHTLSTSLRHLCRISVPRVSIWFKLELCVVDALNLDCVWLFEHSTLIEVPTLLSIGQHLNRFEFNKTVPLERMNRLVALVLLLVAVSQVGLAANVLVGRAKPYFALRSNEYLSQNGYYLLMQPDCNLVLYNSSLQPVFQTDSSRSSTNVNCTLVMQDDGNLVVYNFTDPSKVIYNSSFAVWAQNFYPGAAGNRSFLLVGGDGSLSYYTTNSTIRPGFTFEGNNRTDSVYPKFNPDSTDYTAWWPNDSLDDFPYMPAGYFLDAGKKLLAMSAQYSLELGTDCNLQSKHLRYTGPPEVLWNASTGSAENRSCRLSIEPNGSLVLSDLTQDTVIWSTNKTGASSVSWILKLDPDNGTLTVSDITDKTNVLWTNADVSLLPPPRKSSQLVVLMVVGALGGAFVLAAVVLGLCFCRRRSHADPAEKAFQAKLRDTGGNSQAFSETEIKKATMNYERVIGQGGFGDVFYGKLSGGQEVAAKVLSATSHQSKVEFFNEIELLSKVHHKYLVSLLGYNCTSKQQVLIYEYMGGGDLRHKLQGETGTAYPLSWRQRTSIILQVAEGLEYLHDKCSPPVIHRDIKSTNILLTTKMVAKVADFGLSKLKIIGQEDATHITTVVKGTPGYLDPEYHETGLLTEKSDVYAFGVVVMEIVTGQHPMFITQRVGEAWRQEKLDSLVDPNVGEDYDSQELVDMVELALWCVRRSNMERPFMRQVVRRLHDLGLASSEPRQPGMALGEEDQYEARSNALSSELFIEDSDTVPLSEPSSSSALSFETSNSSYRIRQHGVELLTLSNR